MNITEGGVLMDEREQLEQERFMIDGQISKKEMQKLKNDYVDELGQMFRIFLDYDTDALVRLAIADYNFRNPHHFISTKVIKRIIKRASAHVIPEGAQNIFVIHNRDSRYKGLHQLVGKDYALIMRDPTVRGRMISFFKDVRSAHFRYA